MKSVFISVRWPDGGRNDPLVGLKLNSYEGTEELKKVILVIEDCLKKNLPGVPVNRIESAKKIFKDKT